jgi:aldose 1-epimerase
MMNQSPDVVLGSSQGLAVGIQRLGARIVSVLVPSGGARCEIAVGGEHRAGATIGRYANRIAGGSIELDGHTYELSRNEGANTLHGGAVGFDSATWELVEQSPSRARLQHLSPDGDQGFPGRLLVEVCFTARDLALEIAYTARTDKPTVVNLTNHLYVNLAGTGAITDQELQIFAMRYTPVDSASIPTGDLLPVADSRFDFRSRRRIGPDHYDTNWVLDGPAEQLKQAASAIDPKSGRNVSVFTTEPGLQVYTPAGGGAFTLETQHFADSPHHPNFPSTVLRPGLDFGSRTLLDFGR